MRTLDPHEELGMPWDDWADGNAHMLTRGRDFFRNPEVVQEAAQNAARRLDRAVSVVKENRVGKTHVWVQFLDYQVEWGQPCPCGSRKLLQINGQFAECQACGATLVLVRTKEKQTDVDVLDEPAAAVLQPLFRVTSPPKSKRRERERPAGDASAITSVEMQQRWERAKADNPTLARQWTRRSFNDWAAIILSGAFAPDGRPVTRLNVEEQVDVCILFEFAVKQVDVKCGVVVTDRTRAQRYYILQTQPVRIGQPGRYTIRVTIPGHSFAGGEYTARVSAALAKEADFSRVQRRQAFVFQADSHGVRADAQQPTSDPVYLRELEWTVERGDDPWTSAGWSPGE